MNILYKFECDSSKNTLFTNRLSQALTVNKQDIRHFLRSDMYNFDDSFNPFWWDVDLIALLISVHLSKYANYNVYLECDPITEQYFTHLGIIKYFNEINNTPEEYTLYTPGIPELDASISEVHSAGMHRQWRGLRIFQPNSIYGTERLRNLHKAVNDLLDYSESNNILSRIFFKELFLNNNALVKQGYYTPFRKDRIRIVSVVHEATETGTIIHLCPSEGYINLIKKYVDESNILIKGAEEYYQHDLWSLIQDDEYAKNVANKENYPRAFMFTSAKCAIGPEEYGTNIKLNDSWDAPNTILHNYTLPQHEYVDNNY